MKMPAPKTPTFGDKRPAPASMPAPPDREQPRRVLKPGAKPLPEPQTFRQTNGPLWLFRFAYNGIWITGTGASEAGAIDKAQQFYMRETAQGQKDSEEVF